MWNTTISAEPLNCPFCHFQDKDYYFLQLHIEEAHTDDSPFKVHDEAQPERSSLDHNHKHASKLPRGGDATQTYLELEHSPVLTLAAQGVPLEEVWVQCPQADCGEDVLAADLEEHLDMHMAENLEIEERIDSKASSSGYPSSHLKVRDMGSCLSSRNSSPRNSNALLAMREQGSLEHYPLISQNSARHVPTEPSAVAEGAKTIIRSPVEDKRPKSIRMSLARTFFGHGRAASVHSRPNGHRRKHRRRKSGGEPSDENWGAKMRLGKSELGPYAYEERMPDSIYRLLQHGGKRTVTQIITPSGKLARQYNVENETPGLVPVLASLSCADPTVKEAYLCHPSVVHVCKLVKEGGFCGYRNLQMLMSYIIRSRADGYDRLMKNGCPPNDELPGVLLLQDWIEEAWDKGINEVGRIQTGGIRGTRKYIGTPEAYAVLESLDVECVAQSIHPIPEKNLHAHQVLMSKVEQYFQAGRDDHSTQLLCSPDTGRPKVHATTLPPIYLQQPGHSVTIVGFERRKNGSGNLLVYDPMFKTSPGLQKLLDPNGPAQAQRLKSGHREKLLSAYRRGSKQLGRYDAFEILKLGPSSSSTDKA